MGSDWDTSSEIIRLVCSREFPYLQPWFYNHPYALRCELGVGEGKREYRSAAKRRAWEIFCILFPDGADAIFFDDWMDDGIYGEPVSPVRAGMAALRRAGMLARWLNRYPHRIVRGLDNGEPGEEFLRFRNRIVCFVRGRKINYRRLTDYEAAGDGRNPTISFVSSENGCILSIYDDRGCDVVFTDRGKMKLFFQKLRPFLLEYDLEEMERRVNA